MENNTLMLCVESSSNPLSKDRIPKIIKDEFESININVMEKLFTVHYGITPGKKLHPEIHNASKYGTLGMFGSLRSKKGGNSRRCCISSAHVVSGGQTTYILNATVKLGSCIWPPPVQNHHINVQDISVIPIETNDIQLSTLKGEVIVFDEADRQTLDRRKVFKYGATTDKTEGFICKTDFVLELGNPPINVFLIEPKNKSDEESRFSKPGDSGAVVFTKFGQRVHVFSMIFGGDVNIEGVAKNNSIAVELKYAINQFEKASDKILELDAL